MALLEEVIKAPLYITFTQPEEIYIAGMLMC